ncbi:GumC family protein [Chryseobacterium zhengzhouense]|uniref:non-specific protein-tyrosine kinase n=1 Tax=Chryseobacterium zhengzhouense TaxID=1636086 RepID=A0ABW2M1E2_9FLAO
MDKKYIKEETQVKEIVAPYIKNWKYFLSTTFLILILAIYYIKSNAPVYKIQTSVLIKDAKKMSSASGDFGVLQSLGAFSGMGTNSIENELEIFKSRTIIEDVVKQYNFQTPVYAKQTWHDVELYGKSNPYIINVIGEKPEEEAPKKPIKIISKGNEVILSSKEWNKDIKGYFNRTISLPFANIIITKNTNFRLPKKMKMDDVYFYYNNMESTIIDFQESLSVDLVDMDATVIGLAVDSQNKDKAKDFLNSIVRQYNEYAIKDKNIESKKTKDFIDGRIRIISKELGDVETQKEDYKSSNNIVDLPTEAKINLQLKEQSKAQILEIETQLELNKILKNTLYKKGKGDILPVNIGLESEAAAKSIQEYNTLIFQRNKYLENASPDNPLIKEANKQIEEMKSSLVESLQKNVTSLELAKRKVETQLGGSEQMISKIPAREKLFRSIERQQQIKENLYLLLLQKREEAAISMEITAEKARIIDKAFSGRKPISPKKMIILAISLVLGFVIPFLFIYIKLLLQSKIIRRNDLSKLTDVPVLAEIPKLRNKENVLVSFNDVSPMAEAFRIFVTNLKFLLPVKDSPNVILVTSSVKGEGKTFVSTNLSIVLASSRDKVLVIGADIRNPQLQRYNPSMKSARGLTEFLSGEEINVNNIIHPSGYNENCDFIYSGAIPPNPTDLLQNGKLNELLSIIKSQNIYKYIVLDSAPLLLVTDSLLIVEKSDAIVYVTRSEVTEKSYLEFLNNSIESNKLKNVGLVLNGINESNFGYGNKFGYGYHAEEKKWWQFFR